MSTASHTVVIGVVSAFLAGFMTHVLYQRWNVSEPELGAAGVSMRQGVSSESQSHRVKFAPLAVPRETSLELPLLLARDTNKIRGLTGSQARIRGKVFRVGHAAKSNTYFLNFGPSREALTAVIFASAVQTFEEKNLAPQRYEGREVEIEGLVKDHPQYGLEVILENPAQIRIMN